MAFLWAPVVMYWRMLSLESQAVMVQKVQRRSGRRAPWRKPGARLIWLLVRRVWRTKRGRKRIERILRRVRLMKGMRRFSGGGWDCGAS